MMRNESETRASQQLYDAGFFVLRTPLLPFDEYVGWGSGLQTAKLFQSNAELSVVEAMWRTEVQMLRFRLRAVIQRPEIVNALYIASPSLRRGISYWMSNPESKRGIQAERALSRYFARMCGRPIPFGLFSGCSIGEVSRGADAVTALALASRESYEVVSRIDFDFLRNLTLRLNEDPAVASELKYWANPTLLKLSDVWYVASPRICPPGQQQRLKILGQDARLEAVIKRAKSGAQIQELVRTVRSTDPGVSDESARQYIEDLVARDALISGLSPLITGNLIDDLVQQTKSIPAASQIVARVKAAETMLKGIDKKGLFADVEDLYTASQMLTGSPVDADTEVPYQIDMLKPLQNALLNQAVIGELIKGIRVICCLTKPNEPENLSKFRLNFSARYGTARINLLEALDPEFGIGYGASAAAASSVFSGLPFAREDKRDAESQSKDSRDDLQTILMRKLLDTLPDEAREINFQPSDFRLDYRLPSFLPTTFAVAVTVAADSAEAFRSGRFEIVLNGGLGPSGARLCGRFCHAHPGLRDHIGTYLRAEEALAPDCVFAEVVYSPESRAGNVISRPVLREYELVFAGRSGAPAERQIPVSDLVVAVEGEHIYLYSKSLNRPVIPRLTNAHQFSKPALPPIYRFLCELQHQHGVAFPQLSWRPTQRMGYLPRLRLGRLILAPARWLLKDRDLDRLLERDRCRQFIAMQQIRAEKKLPRWMFYKDKDKSLPVDMNSPLSVDAFLHLVTGADDVLLSEMYPPPEKLGVFGPEGRYHHDLVVPFIRGSAPEIPRLKNVHRTSTESAPLKYRSFAPGTEWIYAKVYAGAEAFDSFLLAIRPNISILLHSGINLRWFFVRYFDYERQLRIRFNAEARLLQEKVIPVINDAFHTLAVSHIAWRLQYDTYDREIERYGGVEATAIGEDIFFADSEAIMEVIGTLQGRPSQDERWQLTILGIDLILSDFGFAIEEKWKLMQVLRDDSYRRLHLSRDTKDLLDERFRSERSMLNTILEAPQDLGDPYAHVAEAFGARSVQIRRAVQKLQSLRAAGQLERDLSGLAASHIHMHANRMMASSSNAYELLFYDFLSRLYSARIARQKSFHPVSSPKSLLE